MRITSKYVLIILALFLLAACQPSTATPTQPGNTVQLPAISGGDMPAPAATSASPLDAYPGLATLMPLDQTQAYPGQDMPPAASGGEGYPGPMGVPAVDNRSKVVAQLLEQKAGPSADQVVLRVKVVSSEVIGSMPEFTSQLVGQEAEFVVTLAGLPVMKPGDQFQAEVAFRGDESGGRYFAEKIEKR